METQSAEYYGWLLPLAEEPLDDKDIHSICAHCRHQDLGIVQAKDYVEECLVEEGLMRTKNIHCSKVGFDSLNRDEMGGNWIAVHALLNAIKRAGWSNDETRNAVCAEVFPQDQSEEKFNQRLVQDVPLAPVPDNQLEFTSFGCGHTNAGLRAVDAGCASDDPLISSNGKLSTFFISKTDPRFAAAVEKGLHWKILKYAVRVLYPDALRILIAAYNVYGNIQTKQSEVQGLMQMYRMSKQMHDCGKSPDWHHIKAAVLKNKPPFADAVDFLSEFIIGKAGKRATTTHLNCFIASHRQYVVPQRRISGEVYGALADLPLVNLSWHICFAAYAGQPSARNKSDINDFLSASDVGALAKELQDAQVTSEECYQVANLQGANTAADVITTENKRGEIAVGSEIILLQVKLRLEAAGITEEPQHHNQLNKCLTLLGESLSRFVFGKDLREGRAASHLHVCAWRFLQDMQDQFPDMKPEALSQGWPQEHQDAILGASDETAAASSDASKAKAQAPSQKVYDINEHGVIIDPVAKLRTIGMDIGSIIGLKGVEESFFTIKSAVHNVVVLEALTSDYYDVEGATHEDGMVAKGKKQKVGERDTPVTISEVLSAYETKKTKDMKERHPGWQAAGPTETGADLMFERAFVVLAASQVNKYCLRTFRPLFPLIDALKQPRRMVITKAACPAGQLVIAPLSQVCKSEETAKVDKAAFDKKAKVALPHSIFREYSFYLQPWVDDKRAGAFWFVETTSDLEKVNMRMVDTQCTYSVAGGVEFRPLSDVTLLAPDKTAKTAKSADKATKSAKAAADKTAKAVKSADKTDKSTLTADNELAELAESAGDPGDGRQAEEVKFVKPPEDANRLVARVPFLINIKPLEKGETLFYYEKETKRPAPQAGGPIKVAKVMRTTGK